MKLILFALLATAAGLSHAAETVMPSTNATTTETRISSKTVDFDLKSRQAVYRGDVVVDDPRVNVTCDVLTVRLPTNGTRIDSIIAESNVVMFILENGATNRATADKAVYTYAVNAGVTNEVLELTGSPMIESPQGTWTGTRLIWDRVKDIISGENSHMKVRQLEAPPHSTGSTNAAPASESNAVPAPKPATP